MNTTTHEVTTRVNAKAEKVTTAVTINWENISQEDMRKLASRTIIIAAQGNWREAGEIPAEATLDANDFANPTRKPRGPVDVKAMLAKMSPEERAAILAQFAD